MKRLGGGVVVLFLGGVAVFRAGGGWPMVAEAVFVPAAIGVLIGVLLRLADRRHVRLAPASPMSDHASTPLASLSAKVRAATRSRHEALSQLAPELRPVVLALLADRGVAPDDTDGAAELVGSDLLAFVTDRRDPRLDRERAGITLDDLTRHLDRLETL